MSIISARALRYFILPGVFCYATKVGLYGAIDVIVDNEGSIIIRCWLRNDAYVFDTLVPFTDIQKPEWEKIGDRVRKCLDEWCQIHACVESAKSAREWMEIEKKRLRHEAKVTSPV